MYGSTFFCLDRYSIQCSIWCSSWQVSWDSLDEYWLRSCFLRKSAFAFHNTSYMLIMISFIHSRRQNQSSKGRPLRYGSGPDPLLRTLQPAKLETYQSFKSNTTMRKEQIAYKTKLSISCWKILYQISFLLTEYRWICFLANAWWLLLAIKISFDGFNLKTSTVLWAWARSSPGLSGSDMYVHFCPCLFLMFLFLNPNWKLKSVIVILFHCNSIWKFLWIAILSMP